MGCFGSMRVFGYQLVGMDNAKGLCLESKPMQGPNMNGFVFWWNIGYS